MKLTMKDKKEESNIVLTQGIDSYRGKPINETLVLVESRLDEINDVICKALADNPKTLLLGFWLFLPVKGAVKERESTMENEKHFKSFIRFLTPEVETETPELNSDIPNCLRFVARKVYVNESQPYFAYKVAILVNQELYEDASTCCESGKCLMDKIVNSWWLATKLDYQQVKGTFANQTATSEVLNNFNESRYEEYLEVHRQLSSYAYAGRGSHLKKKGSFSCSIS